jgi:2-methylcitrate dehydratase PrpD
MPADPLQAKFSIPYAVAFTLLRGPPRVADFRVLDEDAARLATRVRVKTDLSLGESEAIVEADGCRPFDVKAALGSPQRSMNEERLAAKVRSLTSLPLQELVRDDVSAAEVLETVWTVS